jgi:hypothetical protein
MLDTIIIEIKDSFSILLAIIIIIIILIYVIFIHFTFLLFWFMLSMLLLVYCFPLHLFINRTIVLYVINFLYHLENQNILKVLNLDDI